MTRFDRFCKFLKEKVRFLSEAHLRGSLFQPWGDLSTDYADWSRALRDFYSSQRSKARRENPIRALFNKPSLFFARKEQTIREGWKSFREARRVCEAGGEKSTVNLSLSFLSFALDQSPGFFCWPLCLFIKNATNIDINMMTVSVIIASSRGLLMRFSRISPVLASKEYDS